MNQDSIVYQTYVKILERELVCAMGCTEPIALAYCAAKARSVLGSLPDTVTVQASGNIIKNVKSVIVPNTGGRSGITEYDFHFFILSSFHPTPIYQRCNQYLPSAGS